MFTSAERENTAAALPVVTIPEPERMADAEYRQRVILRLLDILLSPESYAGTGRVFVT
jgi:hypothetical protein